MDGCERAADAGVDFDSFETIFNLKNLEKEQSH